MKKIEINTGLDNFLLIDNINEVESETICGLKTFVHAPAFLGIEALAQLGAFHVRSLVGFKKHAFLLKIARCSIPSEQLLDGTYRLSGKQSGHSTSAYSYSLRAEYGNQIKISGEFFFAAIDYDNNFKRQNLESHYQDIFSCLKNDLKTD